MGLLYVILDSKIGSHKSILVEKYKKATEYPLYFFKIMK
jgi:hypothetical protein